MAHLKIYLSTVICAQNYEFSFFNYVALHIDKSKSAL